MKKLEFAALVSIGRYIKRDSVIHKLGAKAKYLWLFALMLAASLSKYPAVLLFTLALALIFLKLSKIGMSFVFRGMLALLPFFLIAALFQVIITLPGDNSRVLVSVAKLSLTLKELLAIAMMGLRFVLIMVSLSLFTSVTTERETASGVEELLAPLRRFGFPARAMALTVALAFRFIPIIANELETLAKAQAVRGADFGTASHNPIRKIRAYLPLIVPLSIRTIERAEALSEAMEARGYGSGPYTRYTNNVSGKLDRILSILAVVFMVLTFSIPASLVLLRL